MSVKITSKLPSDERNGLGAISAALVGNPEGTHVIVAIVDCHRITTDCDTGDIIPTARIRAIEGFIGSTADAAELRRLWRRQFERRTGQTELPLEMERALDDLMPPEDN